LTRIYLLIIVELNSNNKQFLHFMTMFFLRHCHETINETMKIKSQSANGAEVQSPSTLTVWVPTSTRQHNQYKQ